MYNQYIHTYAVIVNVFYSYFQLYDHGQQTVRVNSTLEIHPNPSAIRISLNDLL